MNYTRQELVAAMRWLRAIKPEQAKCLSVRSHGWYGHCVWTTYQESGVLMTVRELIEDFRKANQ